MEEKISKYIYGIIRESSLAEEAFQAGSENVYAISHQGLSAIVSDSEIIDLTGKYRDVLARHLVKHEKIVEQIMGFGYTVIPIKLGTFAKDAEEVKDILKKGHELVREVMEKTIEKIEIDVAAGWNDFSLVLKEVSEEKEIKEFKKELLAKPGGVTYEDQMKIGLMVKSYADKKRRESAQKIEEALAALSKEWRAHELMNDQMITNSAYLIDRAKKEEFERKVDELNAGFNERLNFKCVGPLPPYSFYTLEIKKLEHDKINWAKEKLGLVNNAATELEIRHAHRKLAILTHPDKHMDDGKPEEKDFDEITQAYHILLDYCRACEQGGLKEGCSFEPDEFQRNAFLVRLKK